MAVYINCALGMDRILLASISRKLKNALIKICRYRKTSLKYFSFTFVNTNIIVMITTNLQLATELFLLNEVLRVEMRWSIRDSKDCGKSVESVSIYQLEIDSGILFLRLTLFGVVKVL